jgi:DNA-binding NtrC family response regulator
MDQFSILIVEEDNAFARTLAQALVSGSENKYKIELCSSAEMAYPLLEKQDIDLLVASYNLHGEDGLSLIANIRKRNPSVETILLAGEVYPHQDIQAEAGNRYCLTRPFDMLDFLLIVRQVLSPSVHHQKNADAFNLLILEDDEGLRRIYSLALSKFDACQIDAAATLEEARTLLDIQDYDILISDIRIGRDRATEILDEYRQRFNAHGTKIVMCSAFGQYRNLPEDIDHFLEKPISVDRLVNLVGQMTGFQTNGNKVKSNEG